MRTARKMTLVAITAFTAMITLAFVTLAFGSQAQAQTAAPGPDPAAPAADPAAPGADPAAPAADPAVPPAPDGAAKAVPATPAARATSQVVDPAVPAAPHGVVKAAPDTPAGNGTSTDPNIDRGFILPTAMTQPAGSVTYNNYELLLHGVSVGITDRVQGSVTVLSPIVQDMPFVGFAAVKGRVVATERFHLALQGSLGWGHLFSAGILDDANMYSLGSGAFASFCLRQDCSSLVSASATYSLVMPSSGETGHTVIYGGSVVHRVGRHVKLLGEVASAAARAGANNFENLDGVLIGYGLRFHTDSIAADVGFIRPVGPDGSDEFLVGLPFVNVSYRWQ